MSDKQQKAPYPLRMPDEMRDKLKEAAHNNRRSLNAEIVARLENSLIYEGDVIADEAERRLGEDGGDVEPLYLDLSEEKLEEMLSNLHKDFWRKLKKEHGVKINKDKGE